MWDHFFSIMDVPIKRGKEGCPPKNRVFKRIWKRGIGGKPSKIMGTIHECVHDFLQTRYGWNFHTDCIFFSLKLDFFTYCIFFTED
jgi:hypothetical protein